MPAKKIKVIALDAPTIEQPVEEPATEAQGMDEVINDIQTVGSDLDQTTVEVSMPEESAPLPCDSESIPEPKAKSKRKARSPKEVVSLVSEPQGKEAVEEAPVVEETAPETKASDGKKTCPDCGKLVSVKTLKYSHKANCKASKVKDERGDDQPVVNQMDPPFQDTNDEVLLRMAQAREARMRKKIEQFAKLRAHIA